MGNVIAYLNLPYFAKENDLRKEISTFLVAYINIYVILIAISILIAILISNYISRPIKMIMLKIRQVKLGGQNETIDWNRKDEIGQLVEEYNRMIDELARSAELLARSERESAWREMAKQIAHEIKNPLTPMKLSVQYLQRAWQNNTPDWENRLDKFTQTMIEQIDSLSIIATEFSDFAKMPVTKKEQADLVEIIKSSISLFKNYDQVTIDFQYDQNKRFSVFADKEQLLRALNNLLKNSIQAIGDKTDGKIKIILKQNYREHIIEIVDNGRGIQDEIASKIFSPNFTTKSGGMGLGLAIVKNVIDNSGGNITYESAKGRGTTFTILLPAI
jgi:nitrogen fixation/metabolism regulation signal transduction histidine kinase